MASAATAADGSFSVSVSPGTYNVAVDYPGDSTDPGFTICTDNVDLTMSVDDTLTVPVTQLAVTAENSDGDLLQGATIPISDQEALRSVMPRLSAMSRSRTPGSCAMHSSTRAWLVRKLQFATL